MSNLSFKYKIAPMHKAFTVLNAGFKTLRMYLEEGNDQNIWGVLGRVLLFKVSVQNKILMICSLTLCL